MSEFSHNRDLIPGQTLESQKKQETAIRRRDARTGARKLASAGSITQAELQDFLNAHIHPEGPDEAELRELFKSCVITASPAPPAADPRPALSPQPLAPSPNVEPQPRVSGFSPAGALPSTPPSSYPPSASAPVSAEVPASNPARSHTEIPFAPVHAESPPPPTPRVAARRSSPLAAHPTLETSSVASATPPSTPPAPPFMATPMPPPTPPLSTTGTTRPTPAETRPRATPPAANREPETPQLLEVLQLEAQALDGEARLSWILPPNAVGARIARRADRPAQRPDDGMVLTSPDGVSLRDTTVSNGTKYFYSVFCEYRQADGSNRISAGVPITVQPLALPPPVGAMRLEFQNGEARLSWVTPLVEEVRVLVHARPLGLRKGDVLPLSRIASLGRLLDFVPPNSAVDNAPTPGISYYTALTMNAAMAVVGVTERFANLEEARSARLEWNGGQMEAYWQWPPNATLARALWRNDAYPQTPYESPQFKELTRAEFDRRGRLLIPMQRAEDCYLAVFVGMPSENGPVFATANTPGARAFYAYTPPIGVSYAIQRWPKLQLVFSAPAECVLSGIVIVSKAGSPPGSADEGKALHRHDGLILYKGKTVLPLPAPPSGEYIKVFYTEASDYQRFPLSHPEREKMRGR